MSSKVENIIRGNKITNFYIYMYLDTDNIPFYVGKGKDQRYKVYRHLGKNNYNRLLKNKISKIGVSNIKIQFLHENLTEEEAFQQERHWIKYYGRRDLKEGSLCNLTDGGESKSGAVVSKETRQKMSKIHKGKKISKETKQKMCKIAKGRQMSNEIKQKISDGNKGKPSPMKGKKHTEETRQKMSEAHKGKKHTKKSKQKMSGPRKPYGLRVRKNG